MRKKSTAERFFNFVKKDPCGCWRWQGNPGGVFGVGEKTVQVKRWIFEDTYKIKVPRKYLVIAKCRNHDCVNPAHLYPLTRSEFRFLCTMEKTGSAEDFSWSPAIAKKAELIAIPDCLKPAPKKRRNQLDMLNCRQRAILKECLENTAWTFVQVIKFENEYVPLIVTALAFGTKRAILHKIIRGSGMIEELDERKISDGKLKEKIKACCHGAGD